MYLFLTTKMTTPISFLLPHLTVEWTKLFIFKVIILKYSCIKYESFYINFSLEKITCSLQLLISIYWYLLLKLLELCSIMLNWFIILWIPCAKLCWMLLNCYEWYWLVLKVAKNIDNKYICYINPLPPKTNMPIIVFTYGVGEWSQLVVIASRFIF